MEYNFRISFFEWFPKFRLKLNHFTKFLAFHNSAPNNPISQELNAGLARKGTQQLKYAYTTKWFQLELQNTNCILQNASIEFLIANCCSTMILHINE